MKKLEDCSRSLFESSTLILCAGFEDRVRRSVDRFIELDIGFESVFVATYSDKKNVENTSYLESQLANLLSEPNGRSEIKALPDDEGYTKSLRAFIATSDHVVCDITGLNTEGLFRTLEVLANSSAEVTIVYTEADTYHPTKGEIEKYISLDESDDDADFERLRTYEISELIYSGECELSVLDGFEGSFSPGYPFYLIAFLTFKRSRIARLLDEVTASRRLLLIGEPEREELIWRAKALLRINEDLVNDGVSNTESLSTLDHQGCFDFLESLYNSEHGKLKLSYNFMLAPLGSKLQKLACWRFARKHRTIGVVTSSPVSIHHKNYSVGYRDTYVIEDLKQLLDE